MALRKRRREQQLEAFVVASQRPKSHSHRFSTACWRRTALATSQPRTSLPRYQAGAAS